MGAEWQSLLPTFSWPQREIINRSHFKPHTWKRCIDDVFSLCNINKEEINSFIELANSYHPTIQFTVSDKEITFLDTYVYKVERSSKATYEENITQFKRRLRDRGYPDNLIENTLSEIQFSERMSALQNKQKTRECCRLLQNIAHLCLILKTFL